MAGLRLSAFSGMAPRVSKALLKDNEAQRAINVNLSSGELRALFKPSTLEPPAPLPDGVQSIYRHTDTGGDALWLHWLTDVDVVRGPIFDSAENPIYLTGHGTPKKTNSTLAEAGDYLEMGVPNPTTAPTINVTGGTGTPESRVYVYTYISMFGNIEEESGPSPVSAVANVLPGSTVTVQSLPAAAPSGLYNITKVRIYRSVTGTTANPFLKVADVNIGTTSYVDAVTATGLGQQIPSTTWEPPPSDLQGLVGMANGILAGFRGTELYFSEPFIPHAWPSIYSITVEHPIVGLAAFGESLMVATMGSPVVVTGFTPASMSQAKIAIYEPCVSKRSIASDRDGAQYVSPNGVVRISQGFAGLVTKNLFTRDEWQLYRPASMVGEVKDGSYYLFYESLQNPLQKGGLILDSDDAASAVTLTNLYTDAVHVDPASGEMYVVEDDEIKMWEGDRVNFLPYEWRSKVFILPRPLNFGAAQVEAEFEDLEIQEALKAAAQQIIANNQALFSSPGGLRSVINTHAVNGSLLNGSILTPIPPETDRRYVFMRVYCNGRLTGIVNLLTRKTMRLPSGFKGDRWEFEIAGNVPLRVVKIAETAKELVQL